MAFNNAGLGEFGRDADWRNYPSLTGALLGDKHFLRKQLGSFLDQFGKPEGAVSPSSSFPVGVPPQQKMESPSVLPQTTPQEVPQNSWSNMSYGHP